MRLESNPTSLCIPEQNGFMVEQPQRQSASTAFVGSSSPFEFVRDSSSLTRYGPFSSGSMTIATRRSSHSGSGEANLGRQPEEDVLDDGSGRAYVLDSPRAEPVADAGDEPLGRRGS